MNKSLIMISCIAVAGMLIAGCSPAAAPTPAPKAAAPAATTAATPASSPTKANDPAPTPKPASDQPRRGGILTVSIGADPPSLDIHREATPYTFAVTTSTYNGLVKYHRLAWPDVKVVPDLTTSWELSPDGKVYTFKVVKGAKFHNGSPLTVEDVKFSFDESAIPSRDW